jgi:hypothetical protein
LEAGAAVIAALLTGLAASPWMRTALRYGAVDRAVCLFLPSICRTARPAGMEQRNDMTNGHSRRVLRCLRRHLPIPVHLARGGAAGGPSGKRGE